MNKQLVIFAACSAVKEEPSTKSMWFQTFPPYGRYPVGGTIPKADKDAEYVFDKEAAKNIIENFRAAAKKPDWPGILVDEEHFSLAKDKSTGALAWAKDIRQEDDGSIWTRWEFTARGRELWNDKILVNRSPAFYSDKISAKCYRPCELKSIGMTNTPHFEELSTLAAARAAEVNNTQGENQMNKIITELGLAEGASEYDVVAAIKELKNKASAAEAKATEEKDKADKAEAKCREMECDKFLSDNKDKIADVAACKEAFMKDPELAKKCFGACKSAPEKKQTVLGAAKKTPAVDKGGKELGTCREQLAALPMSERAAFYQAHKAEIDAGE